jgi:Fe-Mn family superoxide dismutase
VVEKYPDLDNMGVEELLKNLSSLKVDETDRKIIQNHGGGHANHSLFWKLMDPANKVDDMLASDIKTTFGSTDEFKKQFSDAALKIFGSGWAWLVKNDSNKLSILGLPNQDSPLSQGLTPILGLDVWEHAYYLKYQNKRAEYIENWWKVIKLI